MPSMEEGWNVGLGVWRLEWASLHCHVRSRRLVRTYSAVDLMLCGGRHGTETPKRRSTCAGMADSLCPTAKANRTL